MKVSDIYNKSSSEIVTLWNAMCDQENMNHLYVYDNTDDIINTICEDRTPAEILRMVHPRDLDHKYSIADKYVVFVDNKLVSFTMAYEGKSIIDYERLVNFYVDEDEK